MLCTMERSTDAVLGYKISGDLTQADFRTLNPAVEAAIEANGSVSLLLDLTDFAREKISALKENVDFGQKYQDSVDKMAIVGDKGWEKHLPKLAEQYYATSAQFFDTDDDAWAWLLAD